MVSKWVRTKEIISSNLPNTRYIASRRLIFVIYKNKFLNVMVSMGAVKKKLLHDFFFSFSKNVRVMLLLTLYS